MRNVAVIAVITFLLVACGGGRRERAAGSPDQPSRGSGKTITIKGSDTMVILGQRFAEEYMRQNPATVLQVNGGGSGTGIAALINGTVDLAQSSRPMRDKEKQDVETRRKTKLNETPVALDALAVFVHSSNPVQALTIDQLSQIYTGKITNWSGVGGPDAPIVLYGRENSSGTYEYFKEHVLGKADFAPRTQTLQGTAAVINAVARDRNGIGYGGIAYAQGVRTVGIKPDAAAAAVQPTEENVENGSYPIARNLYFYWVADASPELQQFVEWAISPEGQRLVENVGYYPLPKTAGAPTATQ